MNYATKGSSWIPEAKHVEVLTCPSNGSLVGYSVQGSRPGPNILVSGHSPMAQKIFDMLMALPTLPWLRGSITLIFVEVFDQDVLPRANAHIPKDRLDELLFLPFCPDQDTEDCAVKEGYWSILRLCARLGMIDGRGVP